MAGAGKQSYNMNHSEIGFMQPEHGVFVRQQAFAENLARQILLPGSRAGADGVGPE